MANDPRLGKSIGSPVAPQYQAACGPQTAVALGTNPVAVASNPADMPTLVPTPSVPRGTAP